MGQVLSVGTELGEGLGGAPGGKGLRVVAGGLGQAVGKGWILAARGQESQGGRVASAVRVLCTRQQPSGSGGQKAAWQLGSGKDLELRARSKRAQPEPLGRVPARLHSRTTPVPLARGGGARVL